MPDQTTTIDLAKLFPKLESFPPNEVERWRKTVVRLAPTLMEDGNVLGCTVLSLCQMKHIDVAFTKMLLETEKLLRDQA